MSTLWSMECIMQCEACMKRQAPHDLIHIWDLKTVQLIGTESQMVVTRGCAEGRKRYTGKRKEIRQRAHSSK